MSLNTKQLDKVDATLSSLRLTPPSSTKKPSSKSKFADEESAPDSWEEAASDEEDSSTPTASHKRMDSVNVPSPPPPTPISPPQGNPFASPPPSSSITDRFGTGFTASSERQRPTPASRDSEQRQEKTDTVAKRLIAGALGIKAPKKTDEQRAYDRAIREKEMRRRNEEKEAVKRAEEEAAKARASVWED